MHNYYAEKDPLGYFDLIPGEILLFLEMKSGLNSPQISSDTAFLMNILKKGCNETQFKLL